MLFHIFKICVKLTDYIPQKQGLRPGKTQGAESVHSLTDYIPQKQGLRLHQT